MKITWNSFGVLGLCFGVSFAFGSPTRMAGAESSQSTSQVQIPSRPEQLVFPPLAYEPPSPESYRIVLKSGPVAYVVPDRELPLEAEPDVDEDHREADAEREQAIAKQLGRDRSANRIGAQHLRAGHRLL